MKMDDKRVYSDFIFYIRFDSFDSFIFISLPLNATRNHQNQIQQQIQYTKNDEEV